jgi:butyryl-CoA dehydrogenase
LSITGFLLKRAMAGQLRLLPAIRELMDQVLSGPAPSEPAEGPLAEEQALVASAKKLALFAAGSATQKYMQQIEEQQEIMGAIADLVIEIYAMESALLRAIKLASRDRGEMAVLATQMTQVYLSQAFEKIELTSRKIMASVAEGDDLRVQLGILRRLAKHDPYNTIALRQQIAQSLIENGRYTLVS